MKKCNFFVVFRISNGFALKRQSISVNFWKKSTRFAGFLAMIFTSKWLLASGNHWGLRNAKKILQKFINLEKILEISEKFSIIFVVFRISNRSTLKMQSISNFFNSWQWFSPSWCQVFQWNYTQKCIFSKSHKFFKNLMTSDDKWWWVMMSDDEWWWVMRSDDEWWGVMMRDNELWWVMISDGK